MYYIKFSGSEVVSMRYETQEVLNPEEYTLEVDGNAEEYQQNELATVIIKESGGIPVWDSENKLVIEQV